MKKFYIVIVGLFVGLSVNAQDTWYTLASGDWDDPDIWTQDPAGAVPVASAVPADFDNIVILSGKTVTVPDGKTPYNSPLNSVNLDCGSVTIYGSLDLRTSSGHAFSKLKGSGRLLMAADNYPTIIDDSDFTTKGEGTVVFYGNDFSISSSHTFFNLEVDMNSGQTVSLESDLSLNGSLVVTGGNFGINNGGTTPRNITIDSDVIVETSGGITVGNGEAFHWLNVYGDFTNEGTVDLSNSAQYAEATNGAVKLKFLGTTDNTFVCNGPTNLYRLFVDKGTDKTFKLSVNADQNTNFSLYGPVSGTTADAADGAAGWQRLPIVIENGTLELGSNIVIDRLGENINGTTPNEFTIPETGRLWINGATVTTYDETAYSQEWEKPSDWQGITLFGELKVSNGTLTIPEDANGIRYYDNTTKAASIRLEGGTISTTQLFQDNGDGRLNYSQSGGSFHIHALPTDRWGAPSFDIAHEDQVFEMTGGTIEFSAVNSHNVTALRIVSREGNYNVIGGTIQFNTPTDSHSGNDAKIFSTVPLYNLTINASSGGQEIQVVDQYGGPTNSSSLSILNDLTIGSNSTFNDNGYDISIGRDFNIAGTFTQSGDLVFNGAQDGAINNTTGASVTLPGLHIFKERHDTPGQYYNVSLTGTDNVIIDGTLKLSRGALDVIDFTPQVTDSVVIENGDLTSSGTGGLELTGTSRQYIKGAFGKEQKFGRLILNNTSTSPQIQLVSDINATSVSFSRNQVMNLDVFNLDLESADYDSWGWATSSNYSFRTAGNSADGGLTLPVDLTANYTSGTLVQLFPVETTTGYSPVGVFATGDFSSTNDNGKVTINPVNSYHPTVKNTGDVVQYYWRASSSDFTSADEGNLRYRMYSPVAIANNMNASMVFANNTWNDSGGSESNETINYPFSSYISGDFTQGKNSAFNAPRILYSRLSGVFDSKSTWSELSHSGGQTNSAPKSYDICIVGGTTGTNHKVTIDANGAAASQIEVLGNSDLGNSGTPPTLYVESGTSGHSVDLIKGNGRLVYENNSDYWFTHINGDHSELCNSSEAIFEYESSWTETSVFPADANIPYYPNLTINQSSTGTIQNQNSLDLIVNGDLTVTDGDFLLDGNYSEYVSVAGDVIIDSGTLTYESTGIRYMDVDGDISFTGTGTFNASGGTENFLYLKGNIGLGSSGNLDFASGNLSVYFQGDANSTYSSAGSVASFYRAIVAKTTGVKVDFTSNFTLSAPTNGATKALVLQSGESHLNNASIDIDLTTGGNDFQIPSGSKLFVTAGTVNASGNSGIKLDGSLVVDGGTANIDGTQAGTGTSGSSYIAFTSSGNAYLEVSNSGILNVGDQIRRSTSSDEGILSFNQSNGAVNIGTVGNDLQDARGMFEVLGTGSSFSQGEGDVITIQRSNGSTTVPSLYFNPETISFGAGAGFTFDGSDVTDETFGVYAPQNLNEVTITGGTGNELKLLTQEHTLDGDLSIGANTTFNANGLDLTLKGNLTNNGIYSANNNTTYFTGVSDQTISGTGTISFADVVKQTGVGSLILDRAITVSGDLILRSGVLNTGIYDLTVFGDLANDVNTMSTDPGQGIVMAGTDIQQILGSGLYSTLTINNGNGVVLPTQSGAVNFTNKLRMVNGVFDIGRNLLVLDETASIEAVNSFSNTNMIQTNLSFTDNGIEKIFPVISSSTQFVYPIGSLGKYTPVIMDITGNGNNTGSIRVKAADEHHISVTDRSETLYDDTQNVLQYNWTLDADGISGFSASVLMQGDASDVLVTDGNVASDYITANILLDETKWNKYTKDDFNELSTQLSFTFSGTDDIGVDGDYTAGIADAIPNEVPAFITVANGDYSSVSTWATYDPSTGTASTVGVDVPAGGPRGSIIYVDHTLSFPDNFEAAYRTYINETGVVNIGTSIGHRLGDVFGTGTLKLQSGDLPAGSYDSFFSSEGGILEYSGSIDEYDVLSEIPNVNTVLFSGTGIRNLPNIDVQLHGDLMIDGPDVENTYNSNLFIEGDVVFNSGSYDAGTKVGAKVPTITFNGETIQRIDGDFTGGNALYNLEIDNRYGVTLGAHVEVSNSLIFTEGLVNTGSLSKLQISNTSNSSVVGASSTRYVNGPLVKKINEGTSFSFPVGNTSRYGSIVVTPDVGASGYWEGEYFNASAQNVSTNYGTGIEWVSNNEYWKVAAPAPGLDATLIMRFDSQSGVNEDNALIVEYASPQWEKVDGTVNAGSATVSSVSPVDFPTAKYFSFGVASILPYTWEGDVSDDWFVAGNWSSGIAPSAGNPAIIDGTSTNNPIIDAGDAFCDNLTINSTKSVTVKPGSSLEIGSNLENNGLIVLESTNAALSSLMLPETMTTKGEVNVKLTLDRDHYWYLSTPVKSAEAGWFKPSQDTEKDYVYVFEVIDNRWQWDRLDQTDVTNNRSIAPLQGVAAYYYSYVDTAQKQLDYTGEVYNADVTITPDDPGYHLVGNPFPTAIDWEDPVGWTREGFSNTIWSWINDGGFRVIQTYNNNGDDLPGVWTIEPEGYDASTMSHIPAYQSVWMKQESQAAVPLTVKRAARVRNNDAPLKSASSGDNSFETIRIKAQNDFTMDATVLYFNEQFVAGKSREDSEKRFNGSTQVPEVYTRINNQAMAINGQPALNQDKYTFPFSVRNRIEGQVTLKFDLNAFSSSYDVFLEDQETGSWVNLKEQNEYAYSPLQMGDDHDRFVLHFDRAQKVATNVVVQEDRNTSQINIIGQKDHALVRISSDLLHKAEAVIEVLDVNGRLMDSANTKSLETEVEIPDASGIYIIRVNAGGVVKTEKVVR